MRLVILLACQVQHKNAGCESAWGPDADRHGTLSYRSTWPWRGQLWRLIHNEIFEKRLGQERQSLLAKLLHAMAKALGFKIEQLEIFEGGYTPQFWAEVETEQSIIRKFVVDLAHAKRVVPMGVIDYRSAQQIVTEAQKTVDAAKATGS
jgi:hypothetical protein